MKKVAILLDLGFVLHKLYELLGRRHPTPDEVRAFAQKCVGQNEELFRIYCYHCYPYAKTELHPVTKQQVDFSATPLYSRGVRFIDELKQKDNIAFRSGELSFDGWRIKPYAARQIIKQNRPVQASDFEADIKQKAVDMKIGLDVAWLSSKSLVDKIILVSGDSDLIPAMKFARREGVQIVLVTLNHRNIKSGLVEHCDESRAVVYP